MEISGTFNNYKFHESSSFNSKKLKKNKIYIVLFISTVNTTFSLLYPYIDTEWRTSVVIYPRYEPVALNINETGFWAYGDFSTIKSIKVLELCFNR